MANVIDYTGQNKVAKVLQEATEPLMARQIAELIGESTHSTVGYLQAMYYDGRVKMHERTERGKVARWSIINKPATSRTFVSDSKELYRGPDWSTSISRPGAMDHLKYPSRRGDELVPHTGSMIHMS